jgi:hypothetical protein
MSTRWVTHQGHRILYTDFRDCASEDEMNAVFEKAVQMVLAEPEPVLTLNNFDGVDVSTAFLRKLRTRGADYSHKVRAKAVLGVTGVKKTLINTYSIRTGIDARAFGTEAEAIAYLVSISGT